ncbi:MAG: LamG-like jellyroll fold domain-containing protein [Candidatus Thorarchaeota archaeon]|jgi:hypothetical protein
MTCPWRWLVITDGTTNSAGIRNQVNLLSDHSGFCVTEWEPAITTLKGGGTWKDSSLAHGRRLALNKKANVIETMTIEVRDADANTLIRDTQELRRLLEKARTYWTTDWQTEPVWIEAQGVGESEMRYTLIMDWMTPNDGNPYEQPFWQLVAKAGIDDFSLIMEREPFWRADAPGESTCVEISGQQGWIAYGDFSDADAEIDCGSDAAIDNLPSGGDMTVDGWIYTSTRVTTGIVTIMEKSVLGWTFGYNTTQGLFMVIGGGVADADASSGLDEFVADDTWHHVVAHWDIGTGIIYLAIDGVWVASYPSQTPLGGGYNGDAAADLTIGTNNARTNPWDERLGWQRISDVHRWTVGVGFTAPERCVLPTIDGNTVGQWIGTEIGYATDVPDQGGDANLDGTAADVLFTSDCLLGRDATCLDENYFC